VLPLIVPGPDTTLKLTAFPEAPPVAPSAIGATPNVTGEAGAVNVIVCAACATVTVEADVDADAYPLLLA
jgi:hypothetical protein